MQSESRIRFPAEDEEASPITRPFEERARLRSVRYAAGRARAAVRSRAATGRCEGDLRAVLRQGQSGDGHARRGITVYASDIEYRKCPDSTVLDFLLLRQRPAWDCDVLVSNPPFAEAMEIIEHAFALGFRIVILLLKADSPARRNATNGCTSAAIAPRPCAERAAPGHARRR